MSEPKDPNEKSGELRCSSPNIDLLKRTLKWLMNHNLGWDDESARQLQRDIQEAVDEADGKQFCCETCGNDTDSPEVLCEECQQDAEYLGLDD